MHTLQVKFRFDDAIIPQYATAGSAAFDLHAYQPGGGRIGPGETMVVDTGVSIFIEDPSLCGLIIPRSGLGTREGVVMAHGTGLIDSDYQGPLKVPLLNRSTTAFDFSHNQRIAQMLIIPVTQVRFTEVSDFNDRTDRSSGGFGSTGA